MLGIMVNDAQFSKESILKKCKPTLDVYLTPPCLLNPGFVYYFYYKILIMILYFYYFTYDKFMK